MEYLLQVYLTALGLMYPQGVQKPFITGCVPCRGFFFFFALKDVYYTPNWNVIPHSDLLAVLYNVLT